MLTLKIAACDDDPAQLEEVAGHLRAYAEGRPWASCRIELFESGEDLLDAVCVRGGFDLYLLDVVMPGIDGIETGRRLRANGDAGRIVYLTVSRDFAVESYEVHALDYLVKPFERARLFEVLDRAAAAPARHRDESVVVSVAGGVRVVHAGDILYAERAGRRVRYCCAEETVESHTIRGSFSQAIEGLLKDSRFCMCGSSFAVNLERIAAVSGQDVSFDTGARLSVPRSSAASLKSAWGRFWLNGSAG